MWGLPNAYFELHFSADVESSRTVMGNGRTRQQADDHDQRWGFRHE
jgi:hypothetical protein